MQHIPVAIIGNGVAGLSLSLLLERAGVAHLVLAREQQRKSPCLGETIPPSALVVLEQLGLRALFEESSRKKSLGYHSIWQGGPLTDTNFYFQRPFQYGLKMDKQKLVGNMERLAEKRLLPLPAAWEWNVEARRVEWGNGNGVAAQVYVDATGRSRALLRQMGIAAQAFDQQLAFSCQLPRVRHPQIKHDVFTESFAGGWGNVSGLDGETNSLTLFAEKGSPLAMRLKDYGAWEAALAETVVLKDFLVEGEQPVVRGSAANSVRSAHMAGEDWLALGDAAMAFDPLSSHGISNAVYTAWRASEVIQQHLQAPTSKVLANYQNMLAQIFEGYLAARLQLQGAR